MTIQPRSSSSAYKPLFPHPDRRRFQRVKIRLTGRCMLESDFEYPCHTIDISPGGIQIEAAIKPQVGEKAVVYINALGRFAGKVARTHLNGFAMTIDASPKRREDLADKLTWFANRDALDMPEKRRHERIEPFQKIAILRLPDGGEHIVKILNLSASGVGVEATELPSIGARVSIGKADVTVMRHFDGGFGAEFVTPFAADEIDEATRL
jgi:hypothetical protein